MKLEYLQQVLQDPKLQAVEWFNCHDDPYYFMTNWAYTLDVHDRKDPVKLFPKKEYLRIIVDIWLKEPLLLIPKSRQMMVSWIFTCLYLWDTQFHRGRLSFFQSKKEDDADDLVKRAKFIWDHEPKFLKTYWDSGEFTELKCNEHNQGMHTRCRMIFPAIHSEIRGVAQGGEIIRMHTASGILEDEMAFQPEAKASYTAAKPTISSMGKFTGVSTAEDNTFFEDMVFDKVEI